MAEKNYCAIARQYVDEVLSGAIPACEIVKNACQRQLNDLERNDDDWVWFWSEEAANRVCLFMENLRHVKGRWKTTNLTLEPWQCFIITTIFGWVDEQGLRRFKKAYIEVPRKNGKTFLAAGIALFMLCADGEPGAEIYSAATTREQAKVCWEVAQTMVRKDKEMREYYDVEAGAHSITVLDQSAFYKPLSRDSHSLEGLNPHAAIIDELHAHKNREIYDVLNMATGSRSQPLIFVITTAGDDKTGICYEQHTYVVEILEKKFTDERYFGIIYTLDKDSDWTLESSHRMANPNYGISVIPDDISNSSIAAQRAAGAQNTFLTKRLNVWVNVGVAYFNMLAYSKACVTDLTEADFYGEDCIAAVDLASKDDVCCLGKMFRRDDVRYIFVRHYLPSTVAEPGNHPNHHLYSKWAIERPAGFILTPGNITDYEFIEEDLMADSRNFRITSVGFDPYNATEFATRMMKQGINMVEVPNNVKSFSEPMKLIASLIVSGKLRQNGDPALNWMFGNVRAKIDEKDNVYPKKEKFVSKIDGAVTTIMMVAREFAGGTGESVYEKRGLYGT